MMTLGTIGWSIRYSLVVCARYLLSSSLLLVFLALPQLAFCQDECLDPQGDCTLANPVTFEIEVIVSCGDTVLLDATQELCNGWNIPPYINYEFGTDADSISIWVVIDQCFPEPIIVDGITNTPSGSGTASCDTRLVYTLIQPIDTVEQGLPCEEFFALPANPQLLQSSCGCDSLFVTYFNLGGIDTTYVENSSCDPADVGIDSELFLASTGCDSVVITTTLLDPLPLVAVEDQQVCIGEVITLQAITDPGNSFLWNTGATTSFLEVTITDNYSVTVTDANGCQASASAEAFFGDIEIDIQASVSEAFLLSEEPLRVWQGAAVELQTSVSGTLFDYEVIWNGGPELGDTVLNFVAQESGEIKVAIVDLIGCIGIQTIPFEVRPLAVYIPSAFSPNGDNINDQFNIYTSPNMEEVRLQVFSRSGGMLFDEVRLEAQIAGDGLVWTGWDGSFEGTILPPQVFVYQVSYRGIRGEWQLLSGDLTLMH